MFNRSFPLFQFSRRELANDGAGGERTKTSNACSCQYRDKTSMVSEVERSQQHLDMMDRSTVMLDKCEGVVNKEEYSMKSPSIRLFSSDDKSAASKTENELQVSDVLGCSRYGSRLTVSTETTTTSTCRCESRKSLKPMSHIRVRKARTDRTTRLLIAILCLFLISEFPQVDLFHHNQYWVQS